MSWKTAGEYVGELNPPVGHNQRSRPSAAKIIVQLECEECPTCAVDHVEAVERVVGALPGVVAFEISWD